MKILIAEDDAISRKFISKYLSVYGDCDLTVDGNEVLEAFVMGLDEGEPYDLICLDVILPNIDGIKALRTIRQLEEIRGIKEAKRAKIIVNTSMEDTQYNMSLFETGREVYLNKPIVRNNMKEAMKKLGLI